MYENAQEYTINILGPVLGAKFNAVYTKDVHYCLRAEEFGQMY